MPYLTEEYGNPSSAYRFGKRSAEAVERAREQVAALLGCEPKEILFTSCGTESNNAAINSALTLDPDRQHVVTTRVEHSAITKHCEWLAKRGVEVTWLGVDEQGQIDLQELDKAVRRGHGHRLDHVGEQRDRRAFPGRGDRRDRPPEAGALPHRRGAGGGQDPDQPRARAFAHQFPLGLRPQAALPEGRRRAVREPADAVQPLPDGRRPGARQAGGHGERAVLRGAGRGGGAGGQHMAFENEAVRVLRDEFERRVLETIPDTQVNGDREHRLPNTTSIAFEGIDSEAVLLLLDQAGDLLLGGLGLHDRLGASLACAEGDGILDRAGAVEPAVFVQPVQHGGRGGARARDSARGDRKAAADVDGRLRTHRQNPFANTPVLPLALPPVTATAALKTTPLYDGTPPPRREDDRIWKLADARPIQRHRRMSTRPCAAARASSIFRTWGSSSRAGRGAGAVAQSAC